MAENIYVYRDRETRVSVSKQVERCTNAAYVTADLTPGDDEVQRYTGGRLTRQSTQNAFAFLTFDPAARTLTTRVQLPNGAINEVLPIPDAPYRLYDFDLADINAFMAGRPAPRRDFSFAVALAWPEGTPERFVTTRGVARARIVGIDRGRGEVTARYELAGALNGPLWLDADEGHVVDARFREPNHPGYRDFHLVLREHRSDGAQAWRTRSPRIGRDVRRSS